MDQPTSWLERAGREGIAALATVLALGCSSDGGPSGNDGSIQVAVSPAGLSVPQGSTGSVTASLTRVGGFSGVVTLAIAGLPAGVTTTITPAQLSGTTASATVDVTVAATVALAVYTATITATAQGIGQATTTYQLTVTAAPAYDLSVIPATLPIVGGASSSATVTIERTNFSGPVALALLNPPAGITGVFNPTSSTTNGSALLVSVASNVAPRSYALTIQGTATGPGVRTTTLTVTVPASPVGGNVEFQFCSAASTPVFVAYQDGAGPWQAVPGSSSAGVTRFLFNFTQGRGGVMFVYPPAAAVVADSRARSRRGFGVAVGPAARPDRSFHEAMYLIEVLYASTTEFAQSATESCASTQPTKTVTGTVAGVPAPSYALIALGATVALFEGSAPTNPMTFTGVPPGPVDLVGTRSTPGAPLERVIVMRNLNVPDGGSLPSVIDFNGPASLVPATATVTISGAAGDQMEIFTDLVTANTQASMWSDLGPSLATTRPWGGLGPAHMVSGDFHGLFVFAIPPDGSDDVRVSLKYVGPVANQSLALGPSLGAPATSPVAAGAYPRYRFQGTLPAEYNKGVAIDVLSPEGSGNVFSIIASGAYLTASGNPLAYDFTMPDVSGLPGFPGAARLTQGTNAVAATGFGFTGTGTFDLRPSLGGEYKAAVKGVTITVP